MVSLVDEGVRKVLSVIDAGFECGYVYGGSISNDASDMDTALYQ